jgi:dCMP deaminase
MSIHIPSWDEFFMRHAYLAASKSKDPSTQIGAILVKNGIVVSSGYNGFPRKVLDLPERYADKPTKYAMVVHGESNAILGAARNGITTDGTVMYTQGTPCSDCAKNVIQAGVKEIVVHKQWGAMTNWVTSQALGTKMLQEAGVVVRELDLILGIECLVSGKLIKV